RQMNVPRPHHTGLPDLALPPGERPTREQRDLDDAGGALAAAAGELPIEPRRPMRQPRRAELSGPGAQPLARLGVEGRLAKQTLGQRAHVESGSPNHDGLLSRGPHAGEPDARVPCELTRAIAFPRVDEINAQMGHARPLLLVGLRGADVEPPIDLPRVRGDGQDGFELAPRDGDRRFTDAGGAHEHGNEGAVSSAQTVAPARPSAAVRSWAGRARRAPGGSR